MGYKEFKDFQSMVDRHLLRHRSLLDIMTKYQEAASRVNRAVAKAVTSCGCVEIHAKKQEIPEGISLSGLKAYMDSHLSGCLCDHCRDVIEKELGNQLFFMASLANVLDIRLDDVLENEEEKMDTLGVYGLR